MKYCFLMLIVVAAVTVGGGCEGAKSGQKSQTSPEPRTNRKLTKAEEPLLLLEDDQEDEAAAGNVADNSRCFVCHINYVQEDIAVTHARANIGCADCHGESDEHIADESWASGGNGTAPDIMYPRAKINPACMACHRKDKLDIGQHKPIFAGLAEKKYCTDCHGNHRLRRRRCKWK